MPTDDPIHLELDSLEARAMSHPGHAVEGQLLPDPGRNLLTMTLSGVGAWRQKRTQPSVRTHLAMRGAKVGGQHSGAERLSE